MKLTITYPKSWSDVRYKDYLQLYNHLKEYEVDSPEYQEELLLASAIYLHKVPAQHFLKLPANVLEKIHNNTVELFSQINSLPLIQTITVLDKEYGFIPDLETIAYGEYLDLVEYSKDYYKNIPIIMSILYRPVTKHVGKLYTIEPYSGTNDDVIQLFEHALMMDTVFSATSFFLLLQKDCVNATTISLLKQAQTSLSTQQLETLILNGDRIPHLLRSVTDKLQDLMK
jgi:hypothetical protein